MKRFSCSLFIVLANVIGGVAISPAAPPVIEKLDLCTHPDADNGYNVYHIPGLVVTSKGTVLAYWEARKGGGGDWAQIDILLRRSTDGGRTWDAPRHIAHLGDPVPRSAVALARNPASANIQTVNNPAAIADHRTGTIHFLYCIEYAHAYYMRSDDDGVTFSKPVDITATFDQFKSTYDWKVLAIGPNHGIQLTSGRLVVPVWLSTGEGVGGHRPSVTSTIYSDDGGVTWRAGEIAVPNTPEFVNPNETVVVQVSDGRVMLNVRNESTKERRLVVTSPDGATGWSQPKFDDALFEPICMGAIARFSTASTGDKNRILFANPHALASANGKVDLTKRRNLSIKLSYDEGQTWPVNKTLEAGASGYSDLAVLPDGTILCFYGRGNDPAKSMYKSGSLTLARFNLEWLTDGGDSFTPAKK